MAHHRLRVLLDHVSSAQSGALTRSWSSASTDALPLSFSPDVADALRNGRAVVALESTIISHGMPFPQNVQTAQAVEQVVRDAGAVPATIAILDGVVQVGLTPAQLDTLGRLGSRAQKTSRRDLAFVVATKQPGATTVSATMLIAQLAGIPVFVTGGIGGVHRGAEVTMDVSADLTELGRTPVAVVCAGIKSILDIPKTLEFLETQGVAVVGLGTTEFPAFFTPTSGCTSPLTLESPAQVAAMLAAARRLRLTSGTVIAVPIPAGQAAAAAPLQAAQDQAIAEAVAQGVLGRDVTPFLLKRVNELTQGASLTANIALIKNNARVGAQIAVELAALGSAAPAAPLARAPSARSVRAQPTSAAVPPRAMPLPALVCGGNALDLLARPAPGTPLLSFTSNPGSIGRQWGGAQTPRLQEH